MTANPQSPTGAESETNLRDVYTTVIKRVEHNTGGYQPPLATEASIQGGVYRSYSTHDDVTPQTVHSCLMKACQDGRLFRWRDETDPDATGDSDTVYVGLDEIDALRQRIASYVDRRDDPNTRLIAVANQRIAHLQDQDQGQDQDQDS